MKRKQPKAEGAPTDGAGERPPERPPLYITALTVENLACFGPKQTLDLTDREGRPAQWTLLLGENGVGKTTLLRCIAGLEPVHQKISTMGDFGSPRAVTQLSVQSTSYRPHSAADFYKFGCHLWASDRLSVDGLAKQAIEVHGFASGNRGGQCESLNHRFNTWFGYGASRRAGRGALTEDPSSDPFLTLFDDDADLINAEEWLTRLDYRASKAGAGQSQAKERMDHVRRVLIELLPDVDDLRVVTPERLDDAPRLELKTPYGWVRISELSLGYRTLMAWMVDLAARLFSRYPDSDDPLGEPCVVLVDEIDLHLHPRWQRDLMGYLSARFPKAQFIATAHSPLIVQSAVDANVAVLRRDGDHVVIENDPEIIRGWRIDQILTSDLFGLESARPPAVAQLLEERRALLGKARLSAGDRARLRALEEEIGPLPTAESPADIEAMRLIRQAAERLKQREQA